MLISDCQNDGSFLIHHFLTMYIKGMQNNYAYLLCIIKIYIYIAQVT